MFTTTSFNTKKLNEIKKTTMDSISKRHEEAKKEIAKSLEVIYGSIDQNIKTDNTDDLDMLLIDKIDETARDLDTLLNDLLND